MTREAGRPDYVPRGSAFETPLTFDAKKDSTGLAIKTIKYYRDRNLYTKAIKYGEEWLTVNRGKRPPELLNVLATVYFNRARAGGAEKPNHLEKAEQLVLESMQINSRDNFAARLFAKVLTAQGKIDDAITVLEKALAQNPGDRDALLALEKLKNLKQS